MRTPGGGPGPKRLGVLVIAVAAAAFLFGYWFNGGGSEAPARDMAERNSGEALSAQGETKALYVCPMMDVPPMEHPGRCPVCGMDLVEVSGGESEDQHASRVQLSPEAVKLAEIQTAPVERKPVSAEIRMFGGIEYDPAHVSYVTAFMPGMISRIYVQRAGMNVRWGDPLFDIYSWELYYTQQELLEVMKYVPSFLAFQSGMSYTGREATVQERRAPDGSEEDAREREAAHQKLAAIRHKLRVLGLPKKDVDEIMKRGEATGIATVYATRAGTVIEQQAFVGTYVNTGTPIFTIADARYVWVKLDAYESDLPWLRHGQEVEFQTDAYPGETFKAKIIFIDPIFDPKTRTFKVGAISLGSSRNLRPQMLVRAVVRAEMTAGARLIRDGTREREAPLVIPASAPLITGKRAVVYVAVPGKEGTYEGREILLGPRARDHYVVKDGLDEGELIVVNGSFKLDSAVQILAKPSMMNAEMAGAEVLNRPEPPEEEETRDDEITDGGRSSETGPPMNAPHREDVDDSEDEDYDGIRIREHGRNPSRPVLEYPWVRDRRNTTSSGQQ